MSKNISDTKQTLLQNDTCSKSPKKKMVDNLRRNIVIKKFHTIYSSLSGKRFAAESRLDFHLEDQYYERYWVCEMLKAYFSLFTIIFGIVEYEFRDIKNSKNYDLFLYSNTVFSFLLWINIIFQELLNFEHEKIMGKYTKTEKIFTSNKMIYIVIEILLTLCHPNPIFKNYDFNLYNDVLYMNTQLKINDIMFVITFLRFYYIIRFVLYCQDFMSPTCNRICKSFFFEKNFPFAIRSAMASNPIAYLTSLMLIVLLSFSYALKILERQLQPAFGSLWTCFWVILYTFPTVGYGDFVAKSSPGRAVLILSSMIGVFIDSMIVVTLTNLLIMNKAEKNALKILDNSSNLKAIRESAKKVINIFRKISKSKYNLQKTIAYETKLFQPLRKSLKDFNLDLNVYENLTIDEGREKLRLFKTLSTIMKNYELLSTKHKDLEKEFDSIKKGLKDI